MQTCYLIINLQYYLKILRELQVNILHERGSAHEKNIVNAYITCKEEITWKT